MGYPPAAAGFGIEFVRDFCYDAYMDGMMEFEFAPLEGVTDAVYRRTHRRFYPGIARYYTPFISPTQNHILTPRDKRELAPENNPSVPLVPQLLGKSADDLLWAMRELSAMGYDEVNLNLGCPSGTVTAKGKGAGALADPEALDRLLDALFSAAPLAISVKTRLGMKRPEEFFALLEVFNRYPIRRLILHPRTAAQQYTGAADKELFARAAERTALPLCYNGDLFTAEDIARFRERFPDIRMLMLGRGLVADPGLLSSGDAETLTLFHDALCREYPVVFGSENSALHRMKAIWAFMIKRFPDGEKWNKQLIKTKRWLDYLALAHRILLSGPRKG